MQLLAHLPVFFGEAGAQAVMTLQQRVKTLLQGLDVERAAQPQGGRDMVGRTLGIKLPQKPLALLRIRQFARLIGGCGGRNRQLAKTDALLLHFLQKFAALLRRKAGETVGNAPGGCVFHQLISISSSSDSSALKRTALSAGVWACAKAA